MDTPGSWDEVVLVLLAVVSVVKGDSSTGHTYEIGFSSIAGFSCDFVIVKDSSSLPCCARLLVAATASKMGDFSAESNLTFPSAFSRDFDFPFDADFEFDSRSSAVAVLNTCSCSPIPSLKPALSDFVFLFSLVDVIFRFPVTPPSSFAADDPSSSVAPITPSTTSFATFRFPSFLTTFVFTSFALFLSLFAAAFLIAVAAGAVVASSITESPPSPPSTSAILRRGRRPRVGAVDGAAEASATSAVVDIETTD